MGLGLGRADKLKLTCDKYNRGEQCPGTATCGLRHKCDKEEQYGRYFFLS